MRPGMRPQTARARPAVPAPCRHTCPTDSVRGPCRRERVVKRHLSTQRICSEERGRCAAVFTDIESRRLVGSVVLLYVWRRACSEVVRGGCQCVVVVYAHANRSAVAAPREEARGAGASSFRPVQPA